MDKLLESLSVREQHKIYKKSMYNLMEFWQDRLADKRFGQYQYSEYPEAFKKKKEKGQSMVSTGEFRQKQLANRDITATFRNVSINYRYGRPASAVAKINNSDFSKDISAMKLKTKRIIFKSMKGKSITFKEAQQKLITKLYRKNTYSVKTKEMFTRALVAVNRSDIEQMTAHLEIFTTKEFNEKV